MYGSSVVARDPIHLVWYILTWLISQYCWLNNDLLYLLQAQSMQELEAHVSAAKDIEMSQGMHIRALEAAMHREAAQQDQDWELKIKQLQAKVVCTPTTHSTLQYICAMPLHLSWHYKAMQEQVVASISVFQGYRVKNLKDHVHIIPVPCIVSWLRATCMHRKQVCKATYHSYDDVL